MPTDKTPSAGAVAKANAIRLPFLARGGISDIDGLRDATALALDAFAHEREAVVDKEWLTRLDECDRITCEFYGNGETRTIRLSATAWVRTRAAEARRTG